VRRFRWCRLPRDVRFGRGPRWRLGLRGLACGSRLWPRRRGSCRPSGCGRIVSSAGHRRCRVRSRGVRAQRAHEGEHGRHCDHGHEPGYEPAPTMLCGASSNADPCGTPHPGAHALRGGRGIRDRTGRGSGTFDQRSRVRRLWVRVGKLGTVRHRCGKLGTIRHRWGRVERRLWQLRACVGDVSALAVIA
jgi:hypothetical protein